LFAKNTIADQSITLKTTAQILCGQAFARNAAVTMDTNTISNDCSAFNDDTIRTDYGGSGFRHAQISAVPVPAAPLIIASGLFGVVGVVGVARTRRRSLVAA
jgi:type VI secretion system secreted protein VgrG